jgi:hypothetical protein
MLKYILDLFCYGIEIVSLITIIFSLDQYRKFYYNECILITDFLLMQLFTYNIVLILILAYTCFEKSKILLISSFILVISTLLQNSAVIYIDDIYPHPSCNIPTLKDIPLISILLSILNSIFHIILLLNRFMVDNNIQGYKIGKTYALYKNI